MPRTQSAFKSEVLSRPSSPAVFASAKMYQVGRSERTQKTGKDISGEAWQVTCWDFYDIIGEYRYSVDWVGNLLSKAKLFVTQNGKPTQNEVAKGALDALFGGEDGQSEMLRQLGIHFSIAGEAYIIGEEDAYQDQWGVYAATEVKRSASDEFTVGGRKLEGDPLIMRIWRPHPRKPQASTSPSRAIIAILSELHKLTQHVEAQLQSRLAGAGIFAIPSEISFPSMTVMNENGEAVQTASGAQGFADFLTEVMSTAIKNRSSAEAYTPIILQVAGEYLEKLQHITFWTELDRQAIELRVEAIRRLALGMDMPPEVLTGVADVNHWGAWQIDESAIKAHSEPLLAIITSSLTTGYLRYVLEEEGMSEDEAAEFAIHADTSMLRMRPNRSREAIELWDRGELSGAAMLRENGFDPKADVMRGGERRSWLARKVAQGSTTPELVAEALRMLGVDVSPQTPETADLPEPQGEDETVEARPVRSLEKHPARGVPTRTTTGPPGSEIVAASEVMVFRALERAGNRLKQKLGATCPPGIAAADLYLSVPTLSAATVSDLLTDAWSCTDRFCGEADPQALAAILDSYTRTLLTMRVEHDRDVLRLRMKPILTLTLESV
jgi:hypothetical protein